MYLLKHNSNFFEAGIQEESTKSLIEKGKGGRKGKREGEGERGEGMKGGRGKGKKREERNFYLGANKVSFYC